MKTAPIGTASTVVKSKYSILLFSGKAVSRPTFFINIGPLWFYFVLKRSCYFSDATAPPVLPAHHALILYFPQLPASTKLTTWSTKFVVCKLSNRTKFEMKINDSYIISLCSYRLTGEVQVSLSGFSCQHKFTVSPTLQARRSFSKFLKHICSRKDTWVNDIKSYEAISENIQTAAPTTKTFL